MDKKDIETQIETLKNQNKQFDQLIRTMDKKIRRHLGGWFCLPIVGFLIYQAILQKRKESPSYQHDAIQIKTEIAKNEFQILKLKRELEKIKNSSSD